VPGRQHSQALARHYGNRRRSDGVRV